MTTNKYRNKSWQKILFALAITFFTVTQIFGQTDSIKTEYSEESAETSDFTFKEKYNYLVRAQVEEKSLFKIGFSGMVGVPGFGIFNRQIIPNISFEQKLSPAYSIFIDNQIYTFGRPFFSNYQVSIGARYYYDMVMKIKEGKSANNFSANYFSLQQTTNISLGYLEVEPFLLSFLYGLQRRISKSGYIDFNIGPAYSLDVKKDNIPAHKFILDVNFSIGLGF